MHKHCFRICYRCKIWATLRKMFAPLVSQAGYGPEHMRTSNKTKIWNS